MFMKIALTMSFAIIALVAIAGMLTPDETHGQPSFLIFSIVLFAIYFLPSLVAVERNHKQATPIGILNLFLGWTLLGWVGALVWASSYQEVERDHRS